MSSIYLITNTNIVRLQFIVNSISYAKGATISENTKQEHRGDLSSLSRPFEKIGNENTPVIDYEPGVRDLSDVKRTFINHADDESCAFAPVRSVF